MCRKEKREPGNGEGRMQTAKTKDFRPRNLLNTNECQPIPSGATPPGGAVGISVALEIFTPPDFGRDVRNDPRDAGATPRRFPSPFVIREFVIPRTHFALDFRARRPIFHAA